MSPARRERAEATRDLAAQETGPGPAPSVGRTADNWLHTTHPETGLAVVFKAGELLPEWVEL